jgi:hypothetical protein
MTAVAIEGEERAIAGHGIVVGLLVLVTVSHHGSINNRQGSL